MINILIPIVENSQEFAKFVESKKGKNYKIFIGIREGLVENFKHKNKNVELHKFSNKSNKEEILNSLSSCTMQEGKIIILRRVPSEEEFSGLENSKKDIVSFKRKRGKFASFFSGLIQKIIRKIFAFNYFEDISAIGYSENMFQLLSVCPKLSIASRINKYVGVEVEEIEATSAPVKKDYNTLKTWTLFILATTLLLASIAGAICLFVFVPARVLNIILTVFAIVVVIWLWFVSLTNTMRTIAVGDLHYGRAEEIE